MLKFVGILSAIALFGGGGALALATGGGWTHHGSPAHTQYDPKPGCGPDKSDGYAGKSGWHYGQPPKDHHRGDCPDRDDCERKGGKYGKYEKGKSYGHHDDDCDRDDDDWWEWWNWFG